MTGKTSGLLGAALAVVLSCGPSRDEAVRLKEGANLDDVSTCPSLLCAGQNEFCAELLFEYGRSPPLCVTDDICSRFDCLEEGRRCVLFDGVPVQMRCVKE